MLNPVLVVLYLFTASRLTYAAESSGLPSLLPKDLAVIIPPEMVSNFYCYQGRYYYLPNSLVRGKLFDTFKPDVVSNIMSIEEGKHSDMFLVPILMNYFMPWFLSHEIPSDEERKLLYNLPNIIKVLRQPIRQLLWVLYFATGSVQASESALMRSIVKGFKIFGFNWKDLRKGSGNTPTFATFRNEKVKDMRPIYFMAKCFGINIRDVARSITRECGISMNINSGNIPEVLRSTTMLNSQQIFFAIYGDYPTSVSGGPSYNNNTSKDEEFLPCRASTEAPMIIEAELAEIIVNEPHLVNNPNPFPVTDFNCPIGLGFPITLPQTAFLHASSIRITNKRQALPSFFELINSTTVPNAEIGTEDPEPFNVFFPRPLQDAVIKPLSISQPLVDLDVVHTKYFPDELAQIQTEINQSIAPQAVPASIPFGATKINQMIPFEIRNHVYITDQKQLIYLPPQDGLKLFERIDRDHLVTLMNATGKCHPHLFSIAILQDYLLPAIYDKNLAVMDLSILPYIYECLRPIFKRLLWALYFSQGTIQKNKSATIRRYESLFRRFSLDWCELRLGCGNTSTFNCSRVSEVQDIMRTLYVAKCFNINQEQIAINTAKESKISRAILAGYIPNVLCDSKLPTAVELFFAIEGYVPEKNAFDQPQPVAPLQPKFLKRVREESALQSRKRPRISSPPENNSASFDVNDKNESLAIFNIDIEKTSDAEVPEARKTAINKEPV